MSITGGVYGFLSVTAPPLRLSGAAFFGGMPDIKPARATVEVAGLIGGAKIESSAIV